MANRPLLTRRQSIMAALETVPGVFDYTALKDLEVYDLAHSKNIENIQRVPNIGVMSQQVGWVGGAYPTFTFRTQFRGHSGGKGHAPIEGILYRASGMDQSIVPATSVTYSFSNASDHYKTLSIKFWYEGDGVHSMYIIGVGCIAKWKMTITPGQVVFLDWTLTGKFYEITGMTGFYGEAARPALDTTVLQPKAPKGKAVSYSIDPSGANYYPVGNFELDSGIIHTLRGGLAPAHGYEIPWIGGRDTVGNIQMEQERPGVFDILPLIFAETPTAVNLSLIDSATNVLDIDISARFIDATEAKDQRVVAGHPFECASPNNSDCVITIA